MVVGVTAGKLIGGHFCRGWGGGWGEVGEFIRNFHKAEIYLIEDIFVGKTFSLEKIFVT